MRLRGRTHVWLAELFWVKVKVSKFWQKSASPIHLRIQVLGMKPESGVILFAFTAAKRKASWEIDGPCWDWLNKNGC